MYVIFVWCSGKRKQTFNFKVMTFHHSHSATRGQGPPKTQAALYARQNNVEVKMKKKKNDLRNTKRCHGENIYIYCGVDKKCTNYIILACGGILRVFINDIPSSFASPFSISTSGGLLPQLQSMLQCLDNNHILLMLLQPNTTFIYYLFFLSGDFSAYWCSALSK